MTAYKTISKARRRLVDLIFVRAVACNRFTLAGYFRPEPCDPKYAREALEGSRRAKLVGQVNERGHLRNLTVHVHDNLWYELSADGIRADL